jgi:tRNA threonylcarbamoyl adenosine modification protein (Sua5/YciO/YrdC/YwlC family)
MRLEMHPITPQARLMQRMVSALEDDQVVVYPTDSGYSLGCNARSPKAINRLYHMKRAMKKYVMALMCHDFAVLHEFVKIDNSAFRIFKRYTPGPYTFILPATQKGRKQLDVNRPEIGVRIPSCSFCDALWKIKPDLILVTTAARVRDDEHFVNAADIEEAFGHEVDLIADLGEMAVTPTTIVSLVNGEPEVLREGQGVFP